MKKFFILFLIYFTGFAAETYLGDGVYLLDETVDPTSSVIKVKITDEQLKKLLKKSKDVDCNPEAPDCNINELTYQKELKRITRELIYSKLNNDFDFIYYVLNGTTTGELEFTGRMHPVRVDYKYLSLYNPNGIVDFYEDWGSGDKLKGVFYLPIFNAIKNGPSLHEFAHHWGVSCIDELNAHWGASSAGGQLGGFKYLRELGNNQYQGSMNEDFSGGFGTAGYNGNYYPYSDIELYLMGFKSAQELRNENFVLDIYQNNGLTPRPDNEGKFTADSKISFTIDDISANFGGNERFPTPETSQKEFKVLTIILTLPDNPGETIFEERIKQVVSDINWFAEKTPYSGGMYNFYQATDEIGSVEVSGIKNSVINMPPPTSIKSTEKAVSVSLSIIGITQNLLKLNIVQSGSYDIKIFSANGKILQSFGNVNLNTGINSLKMNNLAKGIYFVKIQGIKNSQKLTKSILLM